MGSFSFTRAEYTTERANLTNGDRYKMLIPKKFGGGFILDTYFDYGIINDSNNAVYVNNKKEATPLIGKSDIYGILAYLNDCENLVFYGDTKPETILDIIFNGRTACTNNRSIGIFLDEDRKKYPLKLVSESYEKSYEECPGRSYSDPGQGFYAGYWDYSKNKNWAVGYQSFKDKIIEAENMFKNNTLDDLIRQGYSLKEINSKFKNEENER